MHLVLPLKLLRVYPLRIAAVHSAGLRNQFTRNFASAFAPSNHISAEIQANILYKMLQKVLSHASKRNARSFATAKPNGKVLITGSIGQIGVELIPFLRKRYGAENVIATDIRKMPAAVAETGPCAYLDVQDGNALHKLVVENNVGTVIHLASLLSAVGEKNPQLAMKVNARGSENVLEVAAAHQLKVFIPSTIAVFGPSTPADNTPDLTILRPTTIYGTTKVYMELLGEYYHNKYGVDFRSIRYPGIISNTALPGGGTTDYAVEIFYEVRRSGMVEDAFHPTE